MSLLAQWQEGGSQFERLVGAIKNLLDLFNYKTFR